MTRLHRAAHAAVWLTLALLLPAILIGGYALRGAAPADPAAIRLPDEDATG